MDVAATSSCVQNAQLVVNGTNVISHVKKTVAFIGKPSLYWSTAIPRDGSLLLLHIMGELPCLIEKCELYNKFYACIYFWLETIENPWKK